MKKATTFYIFSEVNNEFGNIVIKVLGDSIKAEKAVNKLLADHWNAKKLRLIEKIGDFDPIRHDEPIAHNVYEDGGNYTIKNFIGTLDNQILDDPYIN